MSTILCIDDDLVFLTILKKYLVRWGHEVITEENSTRGSAILQSVQPDLLLLDLNMPEMDGFEVLSFAKEKVPDLPIIVISGEGEMDDVIRALRLGANDYLTKPIDQFTILDYSIQNALERATLIKENLQYQESLETKVRERTAELQTALQTIRQNEKKLKTVVENFDGLICLCDHNCRIAYANPALLLHCGRDLVGDRCGVALFGDVDSCPFLDKKMDTTSNVLEYQHPMDKRWYHIIHTPLLSEQGEIVERQLIFFDITEKKQALLDLQARGKLLQEENSTLKANLQERYRFGDIIGKSHAMQLVYQRILQTADSDAGVVISGESGTGKELVARAIHGSGPRKNGPLICVNCGAIPETLIESEFFGHVKGAFSGAVREKTGLLMMADGGTLFLDEIGEISLAMQTKLLRAIEGYGFSQVGGDRTFRPDVRIIAATNTDLTELVKAGEMRQDFFFRIHVIAFNLPPLRKRREDIPLLAEHFLEQLSEAGDRSLLNGRVLAALMDYDWPGNVRELQNTILRYLNLGTLDFLGSHLLGDVPESALCMGDTDITNMNYREFVKGAEQTIITTALKHHGWHRGRTAESLGLDPKTLRKKIKEFGLVKSA